MKKFFSIFFVATMLGMVFTACGDEKDQPIIPTTQNLESVYQNETDAHYLFDIDMDKDSSAIYLYNIRFTIGQVQSPAMNIRIDAPVTVDKDGKVYTYAGTGIHPYMQRGGTMLRLYDDIYLVTDLTCKVDTKNLTYSITFDCHGGHFDDHGSLKPFTKTGN
jgi:hypothetical protein